MNWIIFSNECSGKTTFRNLNNGSIEKYEIIDWDVIKSVPNSNYEYEILLIDLLIEASQTDNKIYLTNIQPPDFILECRDYYKNIRFGIVLVSEDVLLSNIEKRHHPNYNSEYIVENYNKLKNIVLTKNKNFSVFASFDGFVDYVFPKPSKLNITKRIIRL